MKSSVQWGSRIVSVFNVRIHSGLAPRHGHGEPPCFHIRVVSFQRTRILPTLAAEGPAGIAGIAYKACKALHNTEYKQGVIIFRTL